MKNILISNNYDIYKALHYFGAEIERKSFSDAYKNKKIDYISFNKFITELDLQVDALFYPEKYANRVINEKGVIIDNKVSLRLFILNFLNKFKFKKHKDILIEGKIKEYNERIISSMRVIENMEFFIKNIKNKKLINLFKKIIEDHQYWIRYNFEKLDQLEEIQ